MCVPEIVVREDVLVQQRDTALQPVGWGVGGLSCHVPRRDHDHESQWLSSPFAYKLQELDQLNLRRSVVSVPWRDVSVANFSFVPSERCYQFVGLIDSL